MNPTKRYWQLFLLVTLCTQSPVHGDHIGSEISEDILAELSNELKPSECWITTLYLAQRSSNPKAGEEIYKVGGHSKKYNCYEALMYWKEEILPLSEEANEVDGYGLRLLAHAIAFAGRPDLEQWIIAAFLNSKPYYDPSQWTFQHHEFDVDTKKNPPEEFDEVKSKIDQDTEAVGLSFQKELPQFVSTQPPKTEYDSQTQLFATIVSYVVIFILVFVMICFVITTSVVCIGPERCAGPRDAEEDRPQDEHLVDKISSPDGIRLKNPKDEYVFTVLDESSTAEAAGKVTTKSQIQDSQSGTSNAVGSGTDPNANYKQSEDPQQNNNEN